MKKVKVLLMLLFATGLVACSKPVEPIEDNVETPEVTESSEETTEEFSEETKEILEKLGIDPESVVKQREIPGITDRVQNDVEPQRKHDLVDDIKSNVEKTDEAPSVARDPKEVRDELYKKLGIDPEKGISEEDLDNLNTPFTDVIKKALKEQENQIKAE